jgi:DNA-binding MarR family transcriptional regulator
MTSRRLALGLLDAADWFNDGLLSALTAAGWPRLSRHQAQVFPLLGPDGVSQSEISRRLGITRQSVNKLVHELIAVGVLEHRPDPSDRRAKRVVLTTQGRRLAADAARILDRMEQHLADRIGADQVDALRAAVEADWGEPPILVS